MNDCRMPFPRHEGNIFKRALAEVREMFPDWDMVRDTPDCPYCAGTGLAPGDGQTECGFCYNRNHARLKMARRLIVSAIADAGDDLETIDRLSEITTIIDSIIGDHG